MKKIFVYALAALVVTACSKDDNGVSDAQGQLVRLSAGTTETEVDAEARAGFDGVKSIWTDGDEIGVGFDATNTNRKFTQTAGSLSNDKTTVKYEGTLTPPITGNTSCIAYYPYSASATTSGKVVTTTFPAVQNYVAGGYTGAPLFGTYSGDINNIGIHFKNVYSVVKLTLTKDASLNGQTVMLQSIVFKGKNNETVSGAMSVDMSGATPVVSYTGTNSADKVVTLNISGGVELTSTPKTFYIAVPAQNYTQGYTLTFKTDKGQVTKTAKAAGANYAANTVYAAPALAVKDLVVPVIIADVNLRNLLQGLGLINILDPLTGEVSVTALGLTQTTLNLSGGNISSMAGISNFPALTTIDLSNNNLTSLDLSLNPLLVTVNVSGNSQLTSLTLGANTVLATLNCSSCNLASLSIAGNTALVNLNASGNKLTSLSLTANVALLDLNVSGNLLQSLDLSHNALLKNVNVSNNKLTGLSLAANTALLTLDVSTNLLTALDAHLNVLLTSLKCAGNVLTTLNISNLTALVNLELVAGNNSIALLKLTIPAGATVKNLVSNVQKWATFECKNNPTIITISLKTNAALTGGTVTGNAALTTLDVTGSTLALGFTHSGNNASFHIVGPIGGDD